MTQNEKDKAELLEVLERGLVIGVIFRVLDNKIIQIKPTIGGEVKLTEITPMSLTEAKIEIWEGKKKDGDKLFPKDGMLKIVEKIFTISEQLRLAIMTDPQGPGIHNTLKTLLNSVVKSAKPINNEGVMSTIFQDEDYLIPSAGELGGNTKTGAYERYVAQM